MALVTTKNKIIQEDAFFISDNADNDFVICKSPDKLKRLIEAVQHNKNLYYLSDGDWSMHDLLNELTKIYTQATIYITTYAIREFAIRQMINGLSENRIAQVNMLLDYRAKTRTPEVYQLASMNLNRIYLTSIHAKVFVIKSPSGYISIVGSANWTQNPRVECGVISTDKNTALFHIEWIEKLMNNAELFN